MEETLEHFKIVQFLIFLKIETIKKNSLKGSLSSQIYLTNKLKTNFSFRGLKRSNL